MTKISMCPKCRGQKTLPGRLFDKDCAFICHVCRGSGTVSFAPATPLAKVRDTMLGKILEKKQQRLWKGV